MRKKTPINRATRTVTKFLLWPVTIDWETRWLEKVTIKQKFQRGIIQPNGWWVNQKWVN